MPTLQREIMQNRTLATQKKVLMTARTMNKNTLRSAEPYHNERHRPPVGIDGGAFLRASGTGRCPGRCRQ